MKNLLFYILLIRLSLITIRANSQSLESDFVMIDKLNNQYLIPDFKGFDDSIATHKYKLNNANFAGITINFFSESSFVMVIQYSNYCRYIFKLQNKINKETNDTCLNVVSGKCIISDSTIEYTVKNMTFVFDKNTNRLIEFNRFKTNYDSIDYTSFVLNRTIENGSGYSYLFPLQWHLNGNIKSNVHFENDYIYVTNYKADGKLTSLLIYQYFYDAIGKNCILIKEINY